MDTWSKSKEWTWNMLKQRNVFTFPHYSLNSLFVFICYIINVSHTATVLCLFQMGTLHNVTVLDLYTVQKYFNPIKCIGYYMDSCLLMSKMVVKQGSFSFNISLMRLPDHIMLLIQLYTIRSGTLKNNVFNS